MAPACESSVKRKAAECLVAAASKRSKTDNDDFASYSSDVLWWSSVTTIRIVGQGRRPCTIHTAVLEAKCPQLLGVNWLDTDLTTFAIFAVWLYTDQLIPPPTHITGRSPEEELRIKTLDTRLVPFLEKDDDMPLWVDVDLVRLYHFAEQYSIPSLCDAALAELWCHNTDRSISTTSQALQIAFADTEKSFRLENLLVVEARQLLKTQNLNIPWETSDFPPRYFAELLRVSLRHRNSQERSRLHSTRANMLLDINDMIRPEALRKARKLKVHDHLIYCIVGDVVHIIAGDKGSRITLHKELVCKQSDFLRGAFEGRFPEGESDEVDLTSERAEVVAAFAEWLYTGELPTPQHPQRMKWLTEMFIFADRRGVRELRNHIINQLIQDREEGSQLCTSDPELINHLFEWLPRNSRLLRYLVVEAAHYWDHDLEANAASIEAMPPEFLGVAMKLILNRSSPGWTPRPSWRNIGGLCFFHDHADEDEKAACHSKYAEWQRELNKQDMYGDTY